MEKILKFLKIKMGQTAIVAVLTFSIFCVGALLMLYPSIIMVIVLILAGFELVSHLVRLILGFWAIINGHEISGVKPHNWIKVFQLLTIASLLIVYFIILNTVPWSAFF